MKPHRIQLSRAKGWRLPPNTVRVARPGGWGNPFKIGAPGIPDAATAVALYREWIEACIANKYSERNETLDELKKLRDKNLACWCRLDQPCHADVLLEIANQCF